MSKVYKIPGTNRTIRYLENNAGCWKVLRKAEVHNKVKVNFSSPSGSHWLNRVLYEYYHNVVLGQDEYVTRGCNNSWCYNPKHLVVAHREDLRTGYKDSGKLLKTKLLHKDILDIFLSPLSIVSYSKKHNIHKSLISRIRNRELFPELTHNLSAPDRSLKKISPEEKRLRRNIAQRKRYKDPAFKKRLKERKEKYKKKLRILNRYFDILAITPPYFYNYLLIFLPDSL